MNGLVQVKKGSSYVIDSELLAKQESLTAKVQDFQEGVRTRMKQKYARNHKVITFEPDDIVTLRIPKEDRATMDNHRVVVMVKSIPHEGRHQIQAKFGILDRLYPTGELNEKATEKIFLGHLPSLLDYMQLQQSLVLVTRLLLAVTAKKSCTPQSRCKCRKRYFINHCKGSVGKGIAIRKENPSNQERNEGMEG